MHNRPEVINDQNIQPQDAAPTNNMVFVLPFIGCIATIGTLLSVIFLVILKRGDDPASHPDPTYDYELSHLTSCTRQLFQRSDGTGVLSPITCKLGTSKLGYTIPYSTEVNFDDRYRLFAESFYKIQSELFGIVSNTTNCSNITTPLVANACYSQLSDVTCSNVAAHKSLFMSALFINTTIFMKAYVDDRIEYSANNKTIIMDGSVVAFPETCKTFFTCTTGLFLTSILDTTCMGEWGVTFDNSFLIT